VKFCGAIYHQASTTICPVSIELVDFAPSFTFFLRRVFTSLIFDFSPSFGNSGLIPACVLGASVGQQTSVYQKFKVQIKEFRDSPASAQKRGFLIHQLGC
jgi:hypothetical protein